MILTCGCGRWMHTEGIEERVSERGTPQWFIRSECRACGWTVGLDVPAGQSWGLVDRLLWTDEARHRLERFPPYVVPLVREIAEGRVRARGEQVVTYDGVLSLSLEERIEWEPEAERRLEKVPAPVRALAKVELERTAAERGADRITVSLMEEVKAKYFGIGAEG